MDDSELEEEEHICLICLRCGSLDDLLSHVAQHYNPHYTKINIPCVDCNLFFHRVDESEDHRQTKWHKGPVSPQERRQAVVPRSRSNLKGTRRTSMYISLFF